MKFAIIAFATLIAQAVAQGYDVQSNGFRLILKSSTDPALNDHALGACHRGAAHEGLCLTNDTITTPARPYTTFYHNKTSYDDDANTANANNTAGILNWPLSSNFGAVIDSSAMYFYYSGSNLVDMIFAPGNSSYQMVLFEEGSNDMYIDVRPLDTDRAYIPPIKVKNWYVCTTVYAYRYRSLVWNMGLMSEPQDPTCSKVEVQRVWV